jgi:hypothetical protein
MNFIKNLLKPKENYTLVTHPDHEYHVSPEISPANIVLAKQQKGNGHLQEILGLFRKLITDNDNLAGNVDIRKEAAKACDYKFAHELTDKQEEYFASVLEDHLPAFIDQTLELKLFGALFRQIYYKHEDGFWWIDGFEQYKDIDLRIKNKELKLYVEDAPKDLPELNFIRKYNETSVLESLLKYYCFFSFAINNWAQFTETYGKPIRIGKYQPGADPKDQSVLRSMVASLGTDLSAVIPETTLIEFIESKTKSGTSDLYKTLVEFVESRETRRILGQTMTTKESEYAGYAQAKVQDLVRIDLLVADLRDASNYVSDILTRLNRINFADQKVRVELFTPRSIDFEKRIRIDTRLNNIIEIDPEYFYETYSIPEPKGGMKKKEPAALPPVDMKAGNLPLALTEENMQKVISTAERLKKKSKNMKT